MVYTYYGNELYHHGILGQKWDHRNGPPYPLDASDHSSSEKKAGWRQSLKTAIKKTIKRTAAVNKKASQIRNGAADGDGYTSKTKRPSTAMDSDGYTGKNKKLPGIVSAKELNSHDVAIYGKKGAQRIADNMSKGDSAQGARAKEFTRQVATRAAVTSIAAVSVYALSSGKLQSAVNAGKNIVSKYGSNVEVLDATGKVITKYRDSDAVKNVVAGLLAG